MIFSTKQLHLLLYIFRIRRNGFRRNGRTLWVHSGERLAPPQIKINQEKWKSEIKIIHPPMWSIINPNSCDWTHPLHCRACTAHRMLFVFGCTLYSIFWFCWLNVVQCAVVLQTTTYFHENKHMFALVKYRRVRSEPFSTTFGALRDVLRSSLF